MASRYYLFVLLALLSSCCKVPRTCIDVSPLIEYKINKEVHWDSGSEKACKVQRLMSEELTPESIIQIALLNNPEIQAVFEDIGMSKADFLEAQLLGNPLMDIYFRIPNESGLNTNIESALTQSLIDIFLRPLRMKVAASDLEKVTLTVANTILALAFEVNEIYYLLLAKEQELHAQESINDLLYIQYEIAFNQYKAGNINEISFKEHQFNLLNSNLNLFELQHDLIELKEKLNRLMGFYKDKDWTLSTDFEEMDYQGFPLCCLEATAFRERLDLQSARFNVIRLSQAIGLKQWWVYTEGRIGLAYEHDTDGTNVLGPAFVFEIPIFNYGQAQRLRILAELRQAEDRLHALEIQILSQVREAHKHLMNHLDIINSYRGELLPVQKQILNTAEEVYNVMGMGIDELLELKKKELEVYIGYIFSIRDYWMQRVKLDRALGGNLYRVYGACAEGKE